MKNCLIVILGIIIYMCIGSVYSWSIFRKPIEQLLNVSSTLSGLPYTLMLLFFSLTMPFGGKLIQKSGFFFTTLIGAILLSTGFIFSGFSENITSIVVSYGIIGGIGVGLIYGVPIAIITKYFQSSNRGTFLGLTIAGFGLSPFITAPLSKKLLDLYGVFNTFKILGVLFFIIIFLAATLLNLLSKSQEATSCETKSSSDMTKNFSTSQMLRTSYFYGLWLCYTIGCFSGLTIISITSPFAQDIVGLDSLKSSMFVSLFSIFNALGRPLFGYFIDKIKSFYTILTLSILLVLLSILGLFISYKEVLLFFIVFAGFYLLLGGWLATAPSTTASVFGTKYYPSNYGVVFTAYGIGILLGNFIIGRLKDMLGSYRYAFYPTLILGILSIVFCLLLLKNSKDIKP